MRHEWIFDVLHDLADFANGNGLIALAAKVEETILVARAEVAAGRLLHGGEPGAGGTGTGETGMGGQQRH